MANKSKWQNKFLFDAYELAKQGGRENQIAKIFGISHPTLIHWEKKKPLFKMALKMGRRIYRDRVKKHNSELAEYVFNGLSPDMKKVWKRLSKADRAKSSKQIMETILEGRGKTFRQYLFIYAFVNGNFQITAACRKIGISVRTYEKWRNDDPEFAKLFREVLEAKKDLAESHLLKLVKGGSEAATIYATKTLCKDRGYIEKVGVDVNVSGEINHNLMNFEQIKQFLSPAAKIELLDAIRKVKQIEVEEVVSSAAIPPMLSGEVQEARFLPNGH